METVAIKVCSDCARSLQSTEFYAARSTRDGLSNKCKSCAKAYAMEWKRRNRDKVAGHSLGWRAKNKAAIKNRDDARRERIRGTERYRRYLREQSRKRRERPAFKLRDNVRRAVTYAMSGRKNSATFEILGYSVGELIAHIERQFLRGMSWDNYGEWHLDHIVPLSSFDMGDEPIAEVRRAWALTNLRPLWAVDNLGKGSKRIYLI